MQIISSSSAPFVLSSIHFVREIFSGFPVLANPKGGIFFMYQIFIRRRDDRFQFTFLLLLLFFSFFIQRTIKDSDMITTSTITATTVLTIILLFPNAILVRALNICIAGGTGNFGRILASKLDLIADEVTILSRNKFLASSRTRVTETFGWLGELYLNQNLHVTLRDWDGGDLLDIVGSDWLGWQDDTLNKADVVINLVGGYTSQRLMATERIVRESLKVNPNALQITVSPKNTEELNILSPGGATTTKWNRVEQCENMVKLNCVRSKCFRFEANRIDQSCEEIIAAIIGDN